MTGTTDALPNIYGLDVEELAALGPLSGQPAFRSRQIADWLYVHGAKSFEEMTNLPKELRQQMEKSCRIDRGRLVETIATADGSAVKALVGLDDGRAVEAVWIRDDGRETLCISSQVGCAYECDFCATASMPASSNLSAGEILGQIAEMRDEMARREATDLGNIVFMGMGEPLANYNAVTAALRLICGEPGFGIAARRITVSGWTTTSAFCQSVQIRETRTQNARSQRFRRGLRALRCRTACCCRSAMFSSASLWRDLKTVAMLPRMIESMRAMI